MLISIYLVPKSKKQEIVAKNMQYMNHLVFLDDLNDISKFAKISRVSVLDVSSSTLR